jgi:hypothetical protein
VLLPIRRYTGYVDVSIIQCIGRNPDDDHYNPSTSKYHVIGLTDDVMIVMETQDINFVLQLLKIPLLPLHNVTSPEEQMLIKLELIFDELNRYQVLKYGITLTTSVVPYPLEAMGYNWYIMPEGGASGTHVALLAAVTPS